MTLASGPMVRVRHRTLYHFETPVRLGPHTIRLRPAPNARAHIIDYALTIAPLPVSLHWTFDPLANRLARASFGGEADLLEIDVQLTLALTPGNPFDFVLEPAIAFWPFNDGTLGRPELAPFAQRPPLHPWLTTLLQDFDLRPQATVDLLVALNQHVSDRVEYLTRMEAGVQSAAQTMDRGSGSCRDVAWLLVETTRSLGFAARFVSGYLVQLKADGGPARDSVDLHAWAEVYLPGAGWVGFDATSGLIADAGHVALASGVEPMAAAAVDGTLSAAVARLETEMTLTRV